MTVHIHSFRFYYQKINVALGSVSPSDHIRCICHDVMVVLCTVSPQPLITGLPTLNAARSWIHLAQQPGPHKLINHQNKGQNKELGYFTTQYKYKVSDCNTILYCGEIILKKRLSCSISQYLMLPGFSGIEELRPTKKNPRTLRTN